MFSWNWLQSQTEAWRVLDCTVCRGTRYSSISMNEGLQFLRITLVFLLVCLEGSGFRYTLEGVDWFAEGDGVNPPSHKRLAPPWPGR